MIEGTSEWQLKCRIHRSLVCLNDPIVERTEWKRKNELSERLIRNIRNDDQFLANQFSAPSFYVTYHLYLHFFVTTTVIRFVSKMNLINDRFYFSE